MSSGKRLILGLILLGALLLFANLFLALTALRMPVQTGMQTSVWVTGLLASLLFGVPTIILVVRWLLKPYRQLVGVAKNAAPVKTSGTQTRDEAQFVLETFESVVNELQAQRGELERLNARVSQRAATAERFNERVVASVPSSLLAFDAQGRATLLNAAACALFELQPDAAQGKPFAEVLANAPQLAELVTKCLRTGIVFQREEVPARYADGRVKKLGATVAPIDGDADAPHGSGRGALCLVTEVTEILQLRAQVALKKNLENLGEMTAGLAHEFKNSLAALQGYAQLLQRISHEPAAQEAAQELLAEVRQLSDITTSFLNFARPRPLEVGEFSLAELLDDCAQELAALYAERRVELVRHGELPLITGDERMLRQALLNLLRNAAEAIDDAAAVRRVTVRGMTAVFRKSRRPHVLLEIQDTGAGIAPENLERVFIPFFTTKAGGHGVGLALAHRIVTAHGGALTVASAPGGGAVFTVELPLAEAQAEAAA